MALVYLHRRVKDHSIFYVGIGNKLSRAYEYKGRNQRWYDAVHSEPYYVDILLDNISREEALKLEQFVINYYGRIGFEKDGKLVNLCGGPSGFNSIHSHRILQYDLEGNFIKIFYTTLQAAKELNIHPQSISNSYNKGYISNKKWIFKKII